MTDRIFAICAEMIDSTNGQSAQKSIAGDWALASDGILPKGKRK